MTKSEARAARKAAAASGAPYQHPSDTRAADQAARRRAARREHALDRWARRYDALNGAPESEYDR